MTTPTYKWREQVGDSLYVILDLSDCIVIDQERQNYAEGRVEHVEFTVTNVADLVRGLENAQHIRDTWEKPDETDSR